MSNYTLRSELEKIGGVLRHSLDYSTGEIVPGALARAHALGQPAGLPAGDEDSPAGCPQGGFSLSKPHISPQGENLPFVEYYDGASFFKVCRGGEKGEQIGGGKRKPVSKFSVESRRRLMQRIATVDRSKLPLFVTLTYPASFPTARESKKHLDNFHKRMRRRFRPEPGRGYIWKLEPQERGAPHYHLLAWGYDLIELREFVPLAWYEIAGGGDVLHFRWHRGELGNGNTHCVQAVRSFQGVWSYASKYLGKTFDIVGWQSCGRFWGVSGDIPQGEHVTRTVSRSQAVTMMRYQRRFSRRGRRRRAFASKSFTLFCDASQWAARLL
jgi:hypothetical protein